jgi:hypothetical protein
MIELASVIMEEAFSRAYAAKSISEMEVNGPE